MLFMKPTCYTLLGHQSRSQGAEGVKGFSQKPLFSISFHLPVTSTYVMCYSETSHMSHGICGLWGIEGLLGHKDANLTIGAQSLHPTLMTRASQWISIGQVSAHHLPMPGAAATLLSISPLCACLSFQWPRPAPPPSPPPVECEGTNNSLFLGPRPDWGTIHCASGLNLLIGGLH